MLYRGERPNNYTVCNLLSDKNVLSGVENVLYIAGNLLTE